MSARRPLRLPKQWPEHIKSGILHAISLASVALTIARSRATSRRRLQAEVEQTNAEIALLREELYITGKLPEADRTACERQALDAHDATRQVDQDRRESRTSRPVREFPSIWIARGWGGKPMGPKSRGHLRS